MRFCLVAKKKRAVLLSPTSLHVCVQRRSQMLFHSQDESMLVHTFPRSSTQSPPCSSLALCHFSLFPCELLLDPEGMRHSSVPVKAHTDDLGQDKHCYPFYYCSKVEKRQTEKKCWYWPPLLQVFLCLSSSQKAFVNWMANWSQVFFSKPQKLKKSELLRYSQV